MTNLASLDGTLGPADDLRIPVTDEGLLRGDGAFEVMRLYDGRPFALDDHLAAAAAHLRRAAARGRPRRAARRDRRAARGRRPGRRAAALVSPAAAGGSRSSSRCRPRPPARGWPRHLVAHRVLDTLKTLSYAANMLAGPAREGAGLPTRRCSSPRTAACSRARPGRSSGSRTARCCTPPLEERILASITRARLLEECEVDERPCTLDDLRARRGGVHRLDGARGDADRGDRRRQLPAAPGPVTERAAAALQRPRASASCARA